MHASVVLHASGGQDVHVCVFLTRMLVIRSSEIFTNDK